MITEECDEGTAVRRLIRRSRRSLTVTLTGPGRFTEAVLQHLALTPHPVAVQILCVAGFADDLAKRLGEIPAPYRDIRVSDSELRGVLVADGVTALVPGPAGPAVIDDLAAVRALHLLFTQAWSSGRPLADRQRPSARLHTELVQDILQRMREGHTDEVAARAINVSLRTYRRHVAEIMRELDANSRFQAGARAVEYGLLPA
ncbi:MULTISPECIES: response regulator transcription factor [unclassified Streptomyces]|uniref:helix-turn-helix transcriptional regulator n=1 Tax=unclassified Streptomyces TaxID=2593676 RepID=UPI0037AD6FAC